jgi:hypothetical protein
MMRILARDSLSSGVKAAGNSLLTVFILLLWILGTLTGAHFFRIAFARDRPDLQRQMIVYNAVAVDASAVPLGRRDRTPMTRHTA